MGFIIFGPTLDPPLGLVCRGLRCYGFYLNASPAVDCLTCIVSEHVFALSIWELCGAGRVTRVLVLGLSLFNVMFRVRNAVRAWNRFWNVLTVIRNFTQKTLKCRWTHLLEIKIKNLENQWSQICRKSVVSQIWYVSEWIFYKFSWCDEFCQCMKCLKSFHQSVTCFLHINLLPYAWDI